MPSFFARWQNSAAHERSNYALFLADLCHFLDVDPPAAATQSPEDNDYVIDRVVQIQNGDGTTTPGFIDLCKRNCFVLEAKQGSNPVQPSTSQLPLTGVGAAASASSSNSRGTAVRGTPGWDTAIIKAREQAKRYAKALPIDHGWPPFLITTDIAHTFELYADFSLTGKAYVPFPDIRTYRIKFSDLAHDEALRDRLRRVWLDPLSLDPTRRSARVTRQIADHLAALARDLELNSGFDPHRVAAFLMRCIFTSFAEDVHLLRPQNCWRDLLESLRRDHRNFPAMAESLWQTMNTGGFSPILREHVLRFNGGLFESTEALPLNAAQLALLIEAASADWADVEPSIFGTLLERALSPAERSRLGAHYTPRAYVERLVISTIVEPLRDDWKAIQAAAYNLDTTGQRAAAIAEIKAFHRRLCNTHVLDPACGSGNFLYVSFEHMKRLEGEVLDTLESLGETQILVENISTVHERVKPEHVHKNLANYREKRRQAGALPLSMIKELASLAPATAHPKFVSNRV